VNITDIEVDGFGVWNGLKLDELSEHLTVFYGPNEAGKTTLMQFVRSVLYGFSPERRQRYLPPLRGGRPGGSLCVSTSYGSLRISRHADSDADLVSGRISIEGADGTFENEQLLKESLAGIDERTFTNVFAVGLQEIQELGSLDDTAAADMLYKLTTGLDRVSLVDIMRELGASRNHLLAGDGRASQIVNLLTERDRLRDELAQTRLSSRRYAQLASQREQLQTEIARLEATERGIEREVRLVQVAAAVREKWIGRIDVDRQLAALGDLPALPADSLDEFDRLSQELTASERRLADNRQELAKVRGQIKSLAINETLWRLAPRIEALAEQQPWIARLEKEVADSQAEIDRLERQLSDENDRLGLSSDGRQSPGSASLQGLAKGASSASLRQAARELHRAQKQVDELKDDSQQARQKADGLASQIRATLANRPEKDLAAALDHAGGLLAQLRRRVQLDERLEQMGHHYTELAERNRKFVERQLLPVWSLWALGGLFALGVVMVLAGLFLPESLIGSVGWPMATLGLLATMACVGGKYGWERFMAAKLDDCQKQIAMLEAQEREAKKERDDLDAELPRGGGPLLVRVQTAEKDLAALEELLAVDAQRKAAQQEADALRDRNKHAHAEVEDARRRWQQALKAAGLPGHLSPKQVKALDDRRHEIDEVWRQIDRRRQEMAERQRELAAFAGRVTQLVGDVKFPTTSSRVADQLRDLQQAAAAQERRVSERDELRQRARKLRRAVEQDAHAVDRRARRRRRLMRQVGAANEAEFRQLAVQSARAAWLRKEHETLARDIATVLGGQFSEDVVAKHYDEVPAAREEAFVEELARRREGTRQELRAAMEKRGELNHEMQTLSADRRANTLRFDLGLVEKRLSESVERWQVLATTHKLLESIRKTYEAERQPRTLQEASGYLERLTEGHYTRVWTPLDENVLKVNDNAGHTLPVEVLSRGTREQLFLSLRLALVTEFAQRGVRLPLVLDDVLVNFDVRRAKAAAGVLRDFAATGHQLLVFTCHEHVSKLFKSLKVPTCRLPSNSELAATPAPVVHVEPTEPAEPRELEPIPQIAAVAPPAPEPTPIVPPLSLDAAPSMTVTEEPATPVFVAPSEPPAPAIPEVTSLPIRVRRKRERKPEPFANAVWHEPVTDDDDFEIWAEPADLSSPSHHDRFSSFDDYDFAEPEDIEAA
jgi:uncharacterized protein YhaN